MAKVLIGNVKGPQGDAATVAVGTVTTGAAGSDAAVTNSGTSSEATFNFTIPRGATGAPGTPGVTDYASSSAAGLVRIGSDFNIDSSTGTISENNTFTQASSLAEINSGDSHATILGKIKKFMNTLMPSTFLVNSTSSTATDKALTANMGKTIADNIETVAGDIATVETSTTASRAYSEGEYLVLNGQLYKVTSAIANGGTITVGTNVSATTAGAQLKSLSDSSAKKRKAIYLGNSYTGGTGSTSGSDGLFAKTKDLFDDARMYIGSGIGFLQYTDHTSTFNSQLTHAITVAEIPLEEVTDIIILSAWGDTLSLKAQGASTFASNIVQAMNALVANAKQYYPNLKQIKLALVETRSHCTISGTSEGDSYYNEPFETHQMFKAFASRCGIDYVGWIGFETFMMANMLSSDHTHPNDLGYETLGTSLRAALTGHYSSRIAHTSFEVPCAITTNSVIRGTLDICADWCDISIDTVDIKAGNTAAQYSDIVLINFDSSISNNYLTLPCLFEKNIRSGGVEVLPGGVVADGIGYRTTFYKGTNGAGKIYGTSYKYATLSNLNNSPVVGGNLHLPFYY